MRAIGKARLYRRRLRFLRFERGATVVEYALMVGLVALVAVSAVALLGTKVAPLFEGGPF